MALDLPTLHPEQSELGKKTEYTSTYHPESLFPISRQPNRDAIGIRGTSIPFYGFDLWNHYEVSWLNEKGKPIVALAEIIYDCASPNIIESKSLKLYFNSFNNTRFKSVDEVQNTIIQDLTTRVGANVAVKIILAHQFNEEKVSRGMNGICLDDIDIECDRYTVNSEFLQIEKDHLVSETLYSNLLKANCLVTHQPDWASVQISYTGKKIQHEALLKYLVSFRNHNEFHEQCIERIFVDIMNKCQPTELTVYGRFTRRGGLDINPYRSTSTVSSIQEFNQRLFRQ